MDQRHLLLWIALAKRTTIAERAHSQKQKEYFNFTKRPILGSNR